MRAEDKARAPARASLSTAIKMLLILSAGLLPLGLVAVLASIDNLRENAADRAADNRVRLEISAQRINSTLWRSALTIRAASVAVSLSADSSRVCETTLARLEEAKVSPARFALYGTDGGVRCATDGYVPPPVPANPERRQTLVRLTADGGALRLTLFSPTGQVEGDGEFSREALVRLVQARGPAAVELRQGERRILLDAGSRNGPLTRLETFTAPIGDGLVELRMTAGRAPISATGLLSVLLPVLMWIAAAVIGWWIVDRFLLRPLVRMQKAVAGYRPGDAGFDLPTLTTPASEIAELGRAFDQVTRTVARHEADLEAAVETQKKLVREVHHRVKNNLQVIASLLNLHARSSKTDEVAAAYASIQRRVDALAIVHRHHYAELEESGGLPLKPLISELAANLRGTAPSSSALMTIRLDVEPLHATQDIAVSIGFLITEIVEFAMLCGSRTVSICLNAAEPGIARLAVEAESLKADWPCDPDLEERFERIVTGLARQLRTTALREAEEGRYSLMIQVATPRPAAAAETL